MTVPRREQQAVIPDLARWRLMLDMLPETHPEWTHGSFLAELNRMWDALSAALAAKEAAEQDSREWEDEYARDVKRVSAERDVLRAQVRAVEAAANDAIYRIEREIEACGLAGDRAGTDLMLRPEVIDLLRRMQSALNLRAALAVSPPNPKEAKR